MPSPVATPVTSVTTATSRRRQRGTRLTIATALLVLAAAVVASSAPVGSWPIAVLAGAVAVALGAAATRITHAELLQSRRDANADRAAQAQAYRSIATRRSSEHARDVERLAARLAEREQTLVEREQTLVELEQVLSDVQKQAAETGLRLVAATRRGDELEHEGHGVVAQLDAAEERAAAAIVRLAEVEQEVDVLRAELDTVTLAWRAAEASVRKRA
ncbi:MAG: hypothetical protein F2667_08670 [Actinobacteria bacterium]|uniref:Unannotated protein n=1 Tax=freshwater metagenome TaxID=449393 RepID=A0A6J6QVQ0_9ZZZZ|nr:hypothetical protein [Actinomycetota bacterium]